MFCVGEWEVRDKREMKERGERMSRFDGFTNDLSQYKLFESAKYIEFYVRV